MKLLNALKGISGEYEINRVLGALGTLVYIVTVPSFVAYRVFVAGKDFDIVAFCTAYPGGLAVCAAAIAGAVSVKDRNVAVAQVTRETGSAPGLASGTPVGPIDATIVNAANNPVPVDQKPEESK